MTVSFTVASIQYKSGTYGKDDNIACLSRLVEEASRNGAAIIVLPEMCTTGLQIGSSANAQKIAETIPGPTSNSFALLARCFKAHIVLGLAESDPVSHKFYNSQIVIAPDGEVIAKYRKVHLFGPDLEWAEKGDLGYQAVQTAWGRIGMGICCDINYWELMGFLTENQVDMLAYSTNWVGGEAPFRYWSEMVAGGGYYLVAANNWGREGDIQFSGGSVILAPDARVLSHSYSPENTIIYARVTSKPQLRS